MDLWDVGIVDDEDEDNDDGDAGNNDGNEEKDDPFLWKRSAFTFCI